MDRLCPDYDPLTLEIIKLTSKLVSIPAQTDLNTEQEIAEFTHKWLIANGLPSQIIGTEQHPSVLCVLQKGDRPVL